MKTLVPVFDVRTDRPDGPADEVVARPVRTTPLRVGLLDNAKPNGDVIVKTALTVLEERGLAADSVFFTKDTANIPAPEHMLREFETCDIVFNALGNCGSCTAWTIHDAVTLERLGVPTVTFVTDTFVSHAGRVSQSLDMELRDLSTVVLPHASTTGSDHADVGHIVAQLADLIEAAVFDHPGARRAPVVSSSSVPADVAVVDIDGDDEAVTRTYRDRGWIDGLPIVAPTPERVAAMVGRYSSQQVLGRVAPAGGLLTIESLAVNAVMAGCEPSYFPVVVGAAKVLLRSEFGLLGVNTTTAPNAPAFVVSGPITREIGLSGGGDVFGSYHRANISIGRAIRLVMIGAGNCRPQDGDMATQGQSAKVGLCFAENLDASPWGSVNAEWGFGDNANTVAGLGITAQMNVLDFGSRTAQDVLKMFSRTMATPGLQNAQGGGGPLLCVGPTRASMLADEGWSRSDVQRWLYEHARVPLEAFSEGTVRDVMPSRRAKWVLNEDRDARIPIVDHWSDITIVVAGGVGSHSVLMPTHIATRPVVEVIEIP